MKDKKIIKVSAIFDNKVSSNTKYEILFFEENGILYGDKRIKNNEIARIDISMCSSQAGSRMKYYLINLNYYVDLIINTLNDQIFHFQIMNDDVVQKIFEWIEYNHIAYTDRLSLMEIYDKYNNDAVKKNNYIALHFKKWAKEFNLDNPRETHLDAIADGFGDTLKDLFDEKLVEKIDFGKFRK